MSMATENDEEIAVLFQAATLGRTDIITKVISGYKLKGLDDSEIATKVSSIREDDGFTPLHIASLSGHSDVIRALLQVGASLTIKSKDGQLPYQIANESSIKAFNISFFEQVALGNSKKIKMFLSAGVTTNITDGSPTNDGPLHWACSFNHIDVAIILLESGCDVNSCNSLGQSPLFIACKNGNYDMIHLLLSEGANNQLKDNEGLQPKDLLNSSLDPRTINLLESPPNATYMYSKSLNNLQETVPIESISCNSHDNSNGLTISEPLVDIINNHNEILSRPQLVFWPPIQIQRYVSSNPLELDTSENLLICVSSIEIDVFPLLTWSGLMDTLDRIGFSAQVKRSPIGAKIRLNINTYVCPKRHQYEISVTTKDISIVANDSTSLLYAVQTFVQLINLQCIIKQSKDENTKLLKIPCVLLQDWPDIPNRGVLWSYRCQARCNSSLMREVVELLSKLHINMLFLTIDTVENNSNIERQPTTKIYALDEVCRRHAVELVPTVNITSIHQKLPKETLNNFSSDLLTLFLLLEKDKVMTELPENSNEKIMITACLNCCTELFTEIKARGFHTVAIVPSSWINTVVDTQTLALNAGLHVTLIAIDEVLPASLFAKPILILDEILSVTAAYTTSVSEKSLSISMVPAFVDSDYLYPSILSKFYCFMFGGFSWNQKTSFDVLNIKKSSCNNIIDYYIPSDYGQLIQPVLTYLLPSLGISKQIQKLLLDIFTGNLIKLFDTTIEIETMKSNSSYDSLDGKTVDNLMYTSTERILWGISTSQVFLSINLSSYFKNNITNILRLYRKILLLSNWKININGKKRISIHPNEYPNEIEEFFSVIFTYSIVCKSIILSYNNMNKNINSNITYSYTHMIHNLSPGIKSDIANSLLSSIEYISLLWKKRYDYTLLHTINKSNYKDTYIIKWINEQKVSITLENFYIFNDKFLRLKYLLTSTVSNNLVNVPLVDLFKCITNDLNMPYTVDEVLQKVLNN